MRLKTLCKKVEALQKNDARALNRPLTLRQVLCLKLIERGVTTTADIADALGLKPDEFRESLLTIHKDHPYRGRPGLGLIESKRVTSSTRPYIRCEYSLTPKGESTLKMLGPLFATLT